MSRINIEREGENHIAIMGWAGSDTPDKCRAIGGGRFKTEPKRWVYPLDLSICRMARRMFGRDLKIGPALNEWARQAIEAEKALERLASASDAELTIVPEDAPAIDAATKTRTYQRVAIRYGAKTGSFLLADQPGLGKTVETLGTIIETAVGVGGTQFHLVLCPSTAVSSVWTPEIQQWLDERQAIAIPLLGSLPQREQTLTLALHDPQRKNYRHVFVITNIESVRIKPEYDEWDTTHKKPVYHIRNAVLPSLFSQVWDTIIVDEAHRALIKVKGAPSQQRAGFVKLRAHRRIALSGTPMRGKPTQLWGTLNWLRPDLYTSYWAWIGRYFQLSGNGYSNYIVGDFQPGGEERLMADTKNIILRRTKEEVLAELPPKQYAGTHLVPDDPSTPIAVWLEPSAKHLKQYQQFEKEGGLAQDGDEVIANGVLSEYTRKNQLSSAVHKIENGTLVPTLDSVKFDWLLEKVEELEGERIVVASRFTQLIDVFAAGLEAKGHKVHKLTGKTSLKRRQAMVADFQSDNPSATVFMLNAQAGGVALTLDKADYLVLLDETTIPDEREQVEDRIHRTSRIHNVTIYALCCLGTQDEEIAYVAAAREDVQKYMLDGTRGVEYARRLYQETRKKVA